MEKLLLTPGEVSTLCNLGRSRTYELLNQGIIPSLRIGKSLRIPVEDLMAWIAAQKEEGING